MDTEDTWIPRIHEYRGYMDTEDTWIIIIIIIIIIRVDLKKEPNMEPTDRRRCAAH